MCGSTPNAFSTMRAYTMSSLAFTDATPSASYVLPTAHPIFFAMCAIVAPRNVRSTEYTSLGVVDASAVHSSALTHRVLA